MRPVRSDRSTGRSRRNRPTGFTLIEILVVVAILGLLIAVLIPALRRARTQARVSVCKANAKQIALLVTQYQSENRGFVPVLYNYWASDVYNVPARSCLLSLALRQQYPALAGSLRNNAAQFPIEQVWQPALRDRYVDSLLPPFFTCPFQRGKGPVRVLERTVNNTLYLDFNGKYESYQTWLHDVVKRGTRLNSNDAPVPWRAKYSVLTWYVSRGNPNRHRVWLPQDARKAASASLSELTILYCGQGEFTVFPDPPSRDRRANVGSHASGVGGGTNAVFADGHIEWVLGTNIGRP